MSPEIETELLTKVRDVHVYLVGDPLHGKKGMIQEHNELKVEVAGANDEIRGLKSWRDNVKLRMAFITGGFVSVWELGKVGIEWLHGSH